MGEMGFPRREFLHDLRWWEVLSINRGYQARCRNMWSATRWQTYNLMTAQVGSEGMRKANINTPHDLLPFPWDKKPTPVITEADQQELQDLMAAINSRQEQK